MNDMGNRASRQAPGIKELARHLGLSISTVSRAMNDRSDVSQATRELVQQAALQLGYTANQSGRTLRQGSTRTVVMTVRTDISRTLAGETFFFRLCEGLQPALAAHDLDLVILPCGSEQEHHRLLRRAVERRLADGFIISETLTVDPRIAYLTERGVPFVALGRTQPGGTHSWLDFDTAAAARLAVARLAGLGHRRIALGTVARGIHASVVFQDAWRDALTEHGLPTDPDLLLQVPDAPDSGLHLGDALLALPNRPTAAILLQETMAPGLYRRLEDSGLRPGADLALIGFRENRVVEHLVPRLTCFRISLPEYGARLGEVIAARITAPPGAPPVQELWRMELGSGASDLPPAA